VAENKQFPSLTTFFSFPLKVSVRGLMSWMLMTVVGEVVLRWLISIVGIARDMEVLGGSAAGGAAVAAASALTTVFFAQNARELAESLVLVCWVV
jgi:hypothetical protein